VVLTPYIKPLTKLIVDYIANEGYDVLDYVALEIPHNLDVARHDQNELPGIMRGMKIANADVLVLSACVQMPSLAVVPKVEALTGKPVVTASIATAYALLRLLNLEPVVPWCGRPAVWRLLRHHRVEQDRTATSHGAQSQHAEIFLEHARLFLNG
jgi:maleate isomerase